MEEIEKHTKAIKEIVANDEKREAFAVMSVGRADTGQMVNCTIGDTSKVYFAIAMTLYELSHDLEKKPLEDVLLRVCQTAYEIERVESADE